MEKDLQERIDSIKHFVGKESWKFPPVDSELFEPFDGDVKVKILRGMLYFYEGQPGVTLRDIRKFFTERAVNDFLSYGYIEKINK